jgi:hypothetical protein
MPRTGAVLIALTLAASAWLLLGGLLDDASLRPPQGQVPWGGAQDLLPHIRD